MHKNEQIFLLRAKVKVNVNVQKRKHFFALHAKVKGNVNAKACWFFVEPLVGFCIVNIKACFGEPVTVKSAIMEVANARAANVPVGDNKNYPDIFGNIPASPNILERAAVAIF